MTPRNRLRIGFTIFGDTVTLPSSHNQLSVISYQLSVGKLSVISYQWVSYQLSVGKLSVGKLSVGKLSDLSFK